MKLQFQYGSGLSWSPVHLTRCRPIAKLSNQQLLFTSLFSMLSPEKEIKWPQLLLSLELAPGTIVRHQGVRYVFCYTDALTVKPIIAGIALDH